MCFSTKSAYHDVWTAYLEKRYSLCVSNEIINEYEEIFAEKTSPSFAKDFVRAILLRPNTIFVSPQFRFNLIVADPDDNKFVDCAIVANAEYIVSQDTHFNILKTIEFPKVNVIRIEEFSEELNKEKYKTPAPN
jgi:putative PIN family toxin of toxin-antitoxin system